jgi:hypothetical protein
VTLPGAPASNFNTYSGYVNVNTTYDSNLFYWLMESQNNPKVTNGGGDALKMGHHHRLKTKRGKKKEKKKEKTMIMRLTHVW